MSRGFLRKSSVNTFIGIVWILFAVSASAQNAVSNFVRIAYANLYRVSKNLRIRYPFLKN